MIQTRGAIHPLLQCQDGMGGGGGGGGEKGGKSSCHYRYNTALGTKKLPGRNKIPPRFNAVKVGYTGFTSSVRLSVRKINYHWKINCCVGRPAVLLEDKLYYWKINCDIGRSVVFSEDQLYWRQSTGIDGNYRSRKITARRWLHKYVGAECGASSFTWYLYQMCNTDVRPSVRPPVDRIMSALYLQQYLRIHFIFAHLIKQL